ncbi:putative ADP-ribosylglycohydrolase [Thozetella sp. PMI_491]|nr:putative ADP-ribosylglycohydrolase [Thozetella sp. PMI_491]
MATVHQLPNDLSTAHPLIRDGLHDRIVGTLVGSSLGDAIGLYTEFLSAHTSAQSYPLRKFTLAPEPTPFYRDMHRMKHQYGDWTDDTDHALLILLSFLHNGEPLPRDFAERLKIWVDMGLRALDTLPLGLGNLVGSIVRRKDFVEDPEGAARARWEATQRNAAPNGSLMRTHPLGVICIAKDEHETFEVAARFSRITHVDPRCVISCVIGTALVRCVARGEIQRKEDVDATIERALEWFLDQPQEEKLDLDELRRHTNAISLEDLKLDEPQKIGYVYKTLGSGVVVLRRTIWKVQEGLGHLRSQLDIFEEVITDLIMEGGDADTNACFAGALAGAYLGYKVLPGHWKHGLRHEQWLMYKAESLAVALGVADGKYSWKEDGDTSPDGGKGLLSQEEVNSRWEKLQKDMFLQLEADAKARSTSIGQKKSGWKAPWKS